MCHFLTLSPACNLSIQILPVLRNLGEDAGFARAGAGTEGDDTDDIVGAAAVGADEGAAGVTHAGGPALAGFTESDNVVGKAPVLSEELAGAPDFAGDLKGSKFCKYARSKLQLFNVSF